MRVLCLHCGGMLSACGSSANLPSPCQKLSALADVWTHFSTGTASSWQQSPPEAAQHRTAQNIMLGEVCLNSALATTLSGRHKQEESFHLGANMRKARAREHSTTWQACLESGSVFLCNGCHSHMTAPQVYAISLCLCRHPSRRDRPARQGGTGRDDH